MINRFKFLHFIMEQYIFLFFRLSYYFIVLRLNYNNNRKCFFCWTKRNKKKKNRKPVSLFCCFIFASREKHKKKILSVFCRFYCAVPCYAVLGRDIAPWKINTAIFLCVCCCSFVLFFIFFYFKICILLVFFLHLEHYVWNSGGFVVF